MTRAPRPASRSDSPDRDAVARNGRGWYAVGAIGALICLGAGFSLLGAAEPATAPHLVPASDVPSATVTSGPIPAATPTLTSPATAAAPTSTPSEAGSAGAGDPPMVPSAAPLAGVPVDIKLSADGPDIPIIPVGVGADGVLDPPTDVNTAGWWVAGPRPGGPGRTLVAGHIDARTQGIGAFAALTDLTEGDRITLTTADGKTLHYRISATDTVIKTRLDPAVLRGTDTSDLLLITCIGDFDPDTHSYDANLLVSAVPDPAS